MNLCEDETTHSVRWKVNLPVIDKHFDDIISFPMYLYKQRTAMYDRPTFIVHGEKSNYVGLVNARVCSSVRRPDDLAFIRQHYSNVHVRTIADAGHLLHAEQPSAFLDAFANFLTAHS